MQTVFIRGIDFSTPEELHVFLAEELGFPDYYGRNLDALHDVLTEISEDTEILVDLREVEDDAMREYLERILQVLQDSAAENDFLKIEVL